MSIADAWNQLEQKVQRPGDTSNPGTPKFKHYRPFVDAVKTFVAEAQDGERIYFGIPEFDDQIRGIGKGQLCIINGYSHSGKTLLLAHILRHNPDKRVCLVIPDEPAPLVLAKLAAAVHRVPADQLEDRVASGDQAAIDMLRSTAEVHFPNLLVFDKPVRAEDMEEMFKEATDVYGGQKPELFVLDYLELLQAGETVPQKADFIKGFGSRHEIPLIVLHQTSRSAGAEGKRMTISSGSYGGEQHATFQIGVWRQQSAVAAELLEVEDKIARAANGGTEQHIEKRDRLQAEFEKHAFTLTAAITKNKRPGRREGRSEIDFELWGDTGIITPLGPLDLPVQYRTLLEQRRAQTQYITSARPVDRLDTVEDVPFETVDHDDYYEEPF